MAGFDAVRPAGVALCASEHDVVLVVDHARRLGLPVRPRGGGHCFAGRSTSEGIVLDLRRLDGVRVSPGDLARVGGGVRLARLDHLLRRAGRALPTGCGATVGIAGLTLGGGLGLLGRGHGLTCDQLVGARVVLANGRVVVCNARAEPDLFWALRGAGGGQFGVVTSFLFATLAEPRMTCAELRWPGGAVIDVICAWQEWAPEAPDRVTADLSVSCLPGCEPEVLLRVAEHLDPGGAAPALRDLVAAVGVPAPGVPTAVRQQVLGWRDLKDVLRASDPPDAAAMVSRSQFMAESMPRSAVSALVDELAGAAHPRRELAFTPMGGAYNRVPAAATAFAHRDARFLLQHVARSEDLWVDRSWAIAEPHASGGVYPNFPDLALAFA